VERQRECLGPIDAFGDVCVPQSAESIGVGLGNVYGAGAVNRGVGRAFQLRAQR